MESYCRVLPVNPALKSVHSLIGKGLFLLLLHVSDQYHITLQTSRSRSNPLQACACLQLEFRHSFARKHSHNECPQLKKRALEQYHTREVRANGTMKDLCLLVKANIVPFSNH